MQKTSYIRQTWWLKTCALPESQRTWRSGSCQQAASIKVVVSVLPWQTDTKPSRCAEHRLPEFVNIIKKQCEYQGCSKRPSFGRPDDTRPSRCLTHRLPGFVSLSKRCDYPKCHRYALYGRADEMRSRPTVSSIAYLNLQRLRGEGSVVMTDATDLYISGDVEPLRCTEHLTPDHPSVVKKQCEYQGCRKRPYFGRPGDTRPSRCVTHRLTEDRDIGKKLCRAWRMPQASFIWYFWWQETTAVRAASAPWLHTHYNPTLRTRRLEKRPSCGIPGDRKTVPLLRA